MNINALRQAQDRIAEAIKALKKTRNEHEEYLKPIETRTRQLLIDPMLEALGWDVRNPAQVHLEYKGTSGKPDYALFSHGNVVALIEAKKLEIPLARIKVEQVIKYARDRALTSLKYVVWTNGDHWQIWSIEEDREESFQLSNTQEYECALKAMPLLRSALEVQKQSTAVIPPPPRPEPDQAQPPIDPSNAGTREPPREATTPVLASHESATAQPKPSTPEPSSSTPSIRQEAVGLSNGGQDQDGWIPLTSLELKSKQKPPSDTNIKFPDSSTKPLKNWADLLVGVAEHLVETGKILAGDYPVTIGDSNGYIVSHPEPCPPTDTKFSQFRGHKKIGDGLWLMSRFDLPNIEKNAYSLLKQFGIDPSTVHVSTNRS